MYNGIKRTVELAQNEMVPLKSSSGEVLSEKNQQMKIWMEHYADCAKHNLLLPQNAFQVLAKKMDAYLSTIIAMKRGMSGVTNALLLFCGTEWPGMDHFKSLLKVRNTTSQKFLILFICSFIICMSTVCLSCYNTLLKKSHNLEKKKLSALNMEQSQNYLGKKLKRIDIFDINAV